MDENVPGEAGKNCQSSPINTHISSTPLTHRHVNAKKHAIFFAWAGFMLVLLLAVPFIQQNAIDLNWGNWLKAIASNLIIWTFFGLLAHFKLDRLFPFDPHFILLPAAAAAIMICILVYLVHDLRALVIGGWFVVLLFGSGLLGFIEAMILNTFMASTHMLTIYLLIQKGEDLSFSYELGMMLPLMVFWTFCAFVLERAKCNRKEKRFLRQQLSEMAYTDSLTSLPNRRAFTQLLENEHSFGQRNNDSSVIAVLDVDCFKQVNDQLGHERGDQVLMDIAHIIRQGIRSEDTAARLGGDEFILFISHAELDDAHIMIERIRAQVEEKMQQSLAPNTMKITLSIGLAQTQKDLDFKAVQRIADQALYKAKELGRNQIYFPGIEKLHSYNKQLQTV